MSRRDTSAAALTPGPRSAWARLWARVVPFVGRAPAEAAVAEDEDDRVAAEVASIPCHY